MRQSNRRVMKSLFAAVMTVIMTASAFFSNGLTVMAEEQKDDVQIVIPEGSALQQNNADDSFALPDEVYDYGDLGPPHALGEYREAPHPTHRWQTDAPELPCGRRPNPSRPTCPCIVREVGWPVCTRPWSWPRSALWEAIR